jgi:hypothetical protein
MAGDANIETVMPSTGRLRSLLRDVHKPAAKASEIAVPSDAALQELTLQQLEILVNNSLSACLSDFWAGTKHRRAAFLAEFEQRWRGSHEFPFSLTQEVSRTLKTDATQFVRAAEATLADNKEPEGFPQRFDVYRQALARLGTMYKKVAVMHSSPEKHIQAGVDTSVLFMISSLNTLPYLLIRAGLITRDMSLPEKQRIFLEHMKSVRDFVTLLATTNIRIIAAMQQSDLIAYYSASENRVPFLRHLVLESVHGRHAIDLDEDGEALLRSRLNGVITSTDLRLHCPALKADIIKSELDFVVELFKSNCFPHLDRLVDMYGSARPEIISSTRR